MAMLVSAAVLAMATARLPPNVVFIVGDDVGYNDFGHFNEGRVQTPTIDGLIQEGIFLNDYYTFKICSPSRAAMHVGRYPWGAGFYDMNADTDHCTTNFTALPEMLQPLGYKTHMIGKYDVGFMQKKCSPTFRGYDTFFGYYAACEEDYWYHGASGGYPSSAQCHKPDNTFEQGWPTDLSNSTGPQIRPAAPYLNGTYNTHLFAAETARLIRAHPVDKNAFYVYLAFMAVHDGCTDNRPGAPFKGLGKQAPLGTVRLYNRTTSDTYKVAHAMYTEMDAGVATVVGALKETKGSDGTAMWDNTVVIFVSDNGGPLDHCTNFPLRGGKHTFYEGGVRVMSWISGPLIPPARRGTRWTGMAASADWYKTITEGVAGGTVPANTGGLRPPDALNLWPAIMDGSRGPRTEVVHQVENAFSCDVTQPGGGCCSSMRMGEMKIIVGGPGDSRTLAVPPLSAQVVPFGQSGGEVEPGTDHARAPSISGVKTELTCKPFCLFNLTADLGEQHDLAGDPAYAQVAQRLLNRLKQHGLTGPPPAYIWSNLTTWRDKVDELCAASVASGSMQPLDG